MTALAQDLRFGVRLLLRNPGFTLVAVLTLALGIGADSAIFSAVRGVMLSALPYPDAHRLVRVRSTDIPHGFSYTYVSHPDFEDLKKNNRSFENMALFVGTTVDLTGRGEPETLRATACSSTLFDVLERAPALGRGFARAEEAPGADRVAVVSNGLWLRRFGGDPQLLGSSVLLNGLPHTVVGIMPSDFFFPDPRNDVWLPHRIDPATADRALRNYGVVARLRSDVSLAQARTDVTSLTSALAQAFPDTNRGIGVSLIDLREVSMGQDERLLMTFVYLAVTFVLLIACANVANLQLARATGRTKELAIRMSLGGGRGRLVRQLLTESLVLALLAGIGGVIVGYWCLKGVLTLAPPDMPNRDRIQMDRVALFYTIGVALTCGVIVGIAPALQSASRRTIDALKEGGRASVGRRRHRLLGAFVIAEVALAALLLVSASLLVRSFAAQTRVDPGFDPRNLLTMRIVMRDFRFGTSAQQDAFVREALSRVEAVPGVLAAGVIQVLPLSGSSWGTSFSVEGRARDARGTRPSAGLRIVTPDCFRTMRIPLLLGRAFTESDGTTQPAAIINLTMAKRYFPEDASPLGLRIALGGNETEATWMPIVGVVADVHHRGLGAPPEPEIYVPYAQQPVGQVSVVVRTAGDPIAAAAAVRSAIWSVDRDQPISLVRSMEQIVEDSVSTPRAVAQIVGLLSLFALLLSGVGIYGVVSHAVGERTQEIGVRRALGAQAGTIRALVLRRGLALVAVGLTVGTIGAIGSLHLLRSQLVGVAPLDPLSYLAAGGALLFVALIAILLPVRRAVAVDPVTALRCE